MSFDDEWCFFSYSPDGGMNWYPIILFDYMTYTGMWHFTIDFAGLQVPDLMVSWSYEAYDWDWGIMIDNVYMVGSPTAKAIVYDEYMYPDIAMGASIAVDFPDWYVDHPANYTVHACTELPNDDYDPNNCSDIAFYVEPGIHDVGFISVDSPGTHIYTDTPYTICGTVENFGDFPETDVCVHAEVYQMIPILTDDLPFLEDFETAALGWSDWTVEEKKSSTVTSGHDLSLMPVGVILAVPLGIARSLMMTPIVTPVMIPAKC
jgi:hypothetical protein